MCIMKEVDHDVTYRSYVRQCTGCFTSKLTFSSKQASVIPLNCSGWSNVLFIKYLVLFVKYLCFNIILIINKADIETVN
jgi:hypothetical protein